jgi:glycosyltransferase involved in cell wall biosynthesis
MGIAQSRLRLIRGSGVDPAQFSVKSLPNKAIFRVLILSRLLYMKGIQVAVEAHEILKRRGMASELAICGAPDPGNPSSIPQATLDRWATLPGVVLLGHVKDIAPVLADCHIVLQPALGGEGLPKSLLEAGACGRGMIASDIPGNTEIVIDGETGLLVPPNDATALADAMQRAMASPADCARWGLAAREKVTREFASPLIRAQHAALYRDLAVSP